MSAEQIMERANATKVAMDILICGDKAVVKTTRQIEVTYIPTYDVYVKNGMFDFGRIPF